MIDAAFHAAAVRCGIKINFAYEKLDHQTIGPRHAVASGMELSVTQNVVFDDRSGSYKFNAQYGYIATLTDRSRKLELWKTSFSVKPGAFWFGPTTARLAAAIPDTLFAQMARDGVVHGCPPAS